MLYGIVYKILNIKNGHIYIGITTTLLKNRWSSHKCESSTCTYLHKAIKKYGETAFIVEELASADSKENLEFLETYFINFYNCIAPNGYNLTTGGGFAGKQSFITKQLKSASHKATWKQLKKDKQYVDNRMRGITKYVKNKQHKIVAVNMSFGTVTRYSNYYEPNLSAGNIFTAVKKGSYYKNHYWFMDNNEKDDHFQQLTLKKIGNRWQIENENPIKLQDINTGNTVILSNIYEVSSLGLDVGLVRKCLSGRLNRAKNWKVAIV